MNVYTRLKSAISIGSQVGPRQVDNSQGLFPFSFKCLEGILCAFFILLAGCDQTSRKIAEKPPSLEKPSSVVDKALPSAVEKDIPSDVEETSSPPLEKASPPPAIAATQPHRLVLAPQKVKNAGIQVEPVKRGSFQNFREYPGTVKPIKSQVAEVSTLVHGRVSKVFVNLGDEVEEGETLALLYSHELGLAQSGFLRAKAGRNLAEKSFARAKYLWKQKAISHAKVLQRQAEWIMKTVVQQQTRAQLRLLGMMDSQIEKLENTQKFHAHVAIKAPFSGRIIGYYITRGEIVEPGTNLFTIADLKKVWVVANIPEIDISKIQKGKKVAIRVASFPKEWFNGEIVNAGAILDPSTRTLLIRVEVQNENFQLKPEMYASVRIYSGMDPNALTVPGLAIQQYQGRPFVFVRHDFNHFELRPVILGGENGEKVKVMSGLAEGELVVTAGSFTLKAEAIQQEVAIPHI